MLRLTDLYNPMMPANRIAQGLLADAIDLGGSSDPISAPFFDTALDLANFASAHAARSNVRLSPKSCAYLRDRLAAARAALALIEDTQAARQRLLALETALTPFLKSQEEQEFIQ